MAKWRFINSLFKAAEENAGEDEEEKDEIKIVIVEPLFGYYGSGILLLSSRICLSPPVFTLVLHALCYGPSPRCQ